MQNDAEAKNLNNYLLFQLWPFTGDTYLYLFPQCHLLLCFSYLAVSAHTPFMNAIKGSLACNYCTEDDVHGLKLTARGWIQPLSN